MKVSFCKKLLFAAVLLNSGYAVAQPNTTIDLETKKPEKYKEKLLKSEKTGEKKYTAVKHFFGNTVTHYNYFFNANVKYQEILEQAKENFTDDYTQLLPFYNYTLATTAQNKDVDSIISKCNAGILLHDLRSDWVDDMYMLLGKAYYLRKDFDSAYYVFQYINYIYAPKDDGYDVPIGSNESNSDGIFTVSTNEKKRPFIQKMILRKPLERNETLIWLVKNYLAQNKTSEASGLISILKNDPIFPKRLHTDLNEVTSYCYYLQKEYDSSAFYLEKSLSNAANRSEKARWEYLIAQMYQLAENYDDANRMFLQAIKHSTNPLIDVYAHLNMIGQVSEGKVGKNKKSKAPVGDVEALNKLARREKYSLYRDIIYYAAGKVSLSQNNKQDAADYFNKSAKAATENLLQKSKSYLALADVEYDLKQYRLANSHYDSVQIKDVSASDTARINARKPSLKIIVKNIDAINLQDSLQALAKLNPKDLNAALKKIYKQYKKQHGGKEEESSSFDFGSDNAFNTTTAPTFSGVDAKPGEFYFANEAVKAQGNKDFKTKWGNRPNVDNWNRAAVAATGKIDDKKAPNTTGDGIKKTTAGKPKPNRPSNTLTGNKIDPMALGNPDMPDANMEDSPLRKDAGGSDVDEKEEVEVTPETLYNSIPLTEEKIKASNNIIIEALFENGETFSNRLEDYENAIATYEELMRRFPNNKHLEQTLFNLSYCYKRANKESKANAILEKLDLGFGSSDYNAIIKSKSSNPEKDAATLQYAGIYNMFLEGKYEQAKVAKIEADSIYKKKYWSPQLSFIESIYYIKQHDDNTAIDRLTLIVKGAAEKPLQEKAAIMIDVLKRRKQIEDYLSNLDSTGHYDSALANLNAAAKDSIAKAALAKEKERQDVVKVDSSLIGKPFVNNPNEPHFAVLLLDNVDDVFIKETISSMSRYNKEQLTNAVLAVSSLKLSQQYNLILIGPLSNAPNGLSYVEDTKPKTTKILPWLPTFKYSYSLIGITNLEILKANNNMDKYKEFLKKTFPGKF